MKNPLAADVILAVGDTNAKLFKKQYPNAAMVTLSYPGKSISYIRSKVLKRLNELKTYDFTKVILFSCGSSIFQGCDINICIAEHMMLLQELLVLKVPVYVVPLINITVNKNASDTFNYRMDYMVKKSTKTATMLESRHLDVERTYVFDESSFRKIMNTVVSI